MKEPATYKSVGGLLTVGLLAFGITACGGGESNSVFEAFNIDSESDAVENNVEDSSDEEDVQEDAGGEEAGAYDSPSALYYAYLEHMGAGDVEAAMELSVPDRHNISTEDITLIGEYNEIPELVDDDEFPEAEDTTTIDYRWSDGETVGVVYRRDEGGPWRLSGAPHVRELKGSSDRSAATISLLMEHGYTPELNDGSEFSSEIRDYYFNPPTKEREDIVFEFNDQEMFESFELPFMVSQHAVLLEMSGIYDMELTPEANEYFTEMVSNDWDGSTIYTNNLDPSEPYEISGCSADFTGTKAAAFMEIGVFPDGIIDDRNLEIRCYAFGPDGDHNKSAEISVFWNEEGTYSFE